MSDEAIVIEVSDKISPEVANKLQYIAASAKVGYNEVEKLKAALAGINVTKVNQLQAAMQKNALSAQKLATEVQRTAVQTANAAAASDRAALAALRLKQAQDQQAASTNRAAASMAVYVRNFIGIAAIAAATVATVKMADAYTVLQNKLQNVTTSQGQVIVLSERLYEIADRTRTPVNEVATSFTRFDRALNILGKSQEDTLRMTETINKALIVSGATASESASALLQLSQAFNSNKLQGEEFRAIAENMPIALDAISKATGRPINELKKMSSEGKITAEVLYRAFEIVGQTIDEKFGKTVPTVSQAFTVLKNNIGQAIGVFNNATGATAGLATAIISISTAIRNFTKEATQGDSAIVGLLRDLKEIFSLIGTYGVQVVQQVTSMFTSLDTSLKSNSVGAKLLELALKVLVTVFQTIAIVGANVAFVLTRIVGEVKTIAQQLVALANFDFDQFSLLGDTWKKDSADAAAQLKAFEQSILNINNTGITTTSAAVALRGAGPSQLGPEVDEKAAKAAEKRATAMAKLNAELNNELARMSMLAPLRAEQARFDAIEETMIGKKITLTKSEVASIKSRIAAIEKAKFVQAEFDRIYEESVAPLRTYLAAQAAAKQLLDQGAISTEAYSRELLKAGEAYAQIIDPMRNFNRDIAQQKEVLQQIGPLQAVTQQMQQVKNDLLAKGIVLSEEETTALQKRLLALEGEKIVNQQLNQIYAETQGAQVQLGAAVLATNQAYEDGMITLDNYKQRIMQLGLEAINLKIQLGNGDMNDMVTAGLGSILSDYEGLAVGLTNTFGDFFTSFTDGFANSVGQAIVGANSLGDALNQVARQALAGVISSLVKLGIQYVVNAALGETVAAAALAATTASSVTAAGIVGGAWAGPAALVSLASFGANAGPAAAGVAAVAGLAKATALSSMLGFEEGGYTGNIGRKAVAGVVHGNEFVMNAEATQRIGVGNLQAMQDGASAVAANSSNVGSANVGNGAQPQFIFQNYGTPKTASVEQTGDNQWRVMMQDIAEEVVADRVPGMMAQQQSDPNSEFSAAQAAYTDVSRRR